MFRDSWPKSHPLEPRTPVYHITWVPPPPPPRDSIPTTNACKVDTSNRNHLKEAGGLRQKKYPLIWIHYEHPLLAFLGDLKWNRVHSRSHPPSSAMIREWSEWSAVIREDRGEPPEKLNMFNFSWRIEMDRVHPRSRRHSPCTDRQHPW